MSALKSPRVRVLLDRDPNSEEYVEIVVQTDNRDLTGYDLARSRMKWPTSKDAPMFWITWLAWHALRRVGQYAGEFDTFNGECVEVAPVDAEGKELDTATGEGMPEAHPFDPASVTAGSSS